MKTPYVSNAGRFINLNKDEGIISIVVDDIVYANKRSVSEQGEYFLVDADALCQYAVGDIGKNELDKTNVYQKLVDEHKTLNIIVTNLLAWNNTMYNRLNSTIEKNPSWRLRHFYQLKEDMKEEKAKFSVKTAVHQDLADDNKLLKKQLDSLWEYNISIYTKLNKAIEKTWLVPARFKSLLYNIKAEIEENREQLKKELQNRIS